MSEATTPRFRSVLDRFVAYKPGKVVVSPEGRSYKLSSNESPHGPLPSVVDAIAEAARNVNRYPDNNATALTEEIAAFCGVPADHVAVGCGSVGMTQMLLEAVAEPGAEVVYAWRSFEAYPLLVSLSGATGVQVPLKDETHDLEAMADAITDRTRLVFVCNPNNPTGTVVRRDELVRFLDAVPEGVLVALDEAYREYVTDVDVPDGIELLEGRDNVAVLRTFSKAYGLAGLRVGYLVSNPKVTAAVRKVYVPFSVSSLAQAAALASLDAAEELMARVAQVVAERSRVRDGLIAAGYPIPETQANFVWLPLGEQTAAFAEHALAGKVVVRPFVGDGARVTIGTPEENDAFLAAARSFSQAGA